MPKKTKREKIIAEYRRKLTSIRETVPASTPYVYYTKSSAPSNAVAFQPMDQAIRKDLIKTLILAVIAIGGEIAISYIM